MVLRRLMKAAGFVKDPVPTTTPVSVDALAATIDGIVRSVPATLVVDQDYNRAQAASNLYYSIARDMEAMIGEGGAYNRPEGMDDDRFRLIRSIKGIGTVLSIQDEPSETVEIDNDVLVDLRDSLYQLRLLEEPAPEDTSVTHIRSEFDEIWQFASMPAEKKIDVYARTQKFSARAEEILIPLLQDVKPNKKPKSYDDIGEHNNDDGGSRDWDLF